jgi:O-antigen ligase
MRQISLKLTYASLFVLCAGIFTSVSFSALSHILIAIPGVYFAIEYSKKRDFKLPMSFWGVIGIILSITLSVIFNLDILEKPLKNLFKFKYFVLPALGLFAYHYLIKDYLDEKKRTFLLYLFIAATTIATISGLIGLYSGFNPLKMKNACHETRACGLYGMYMTYGYGIALFQILLTGIILRRKGIFENLNKYFLYAAWIINFAGLFLAYARGGWIAFLAAVPFFFFKENKKVFISIGLAGLLFAGGSFAVSQKVRDTVLKRKGSNDQRLAFYSAAYNAFKEKPLFGYGYKNFESNSKDIKKRHKIPFAYQSGHAHNNFMEHLASTGAIGAIAFLLFCLFWGIETYKYSYLGFPFFVGFFTSGMFQYTFGDGENMFLIMAIWALTALEAVKGRQS